MGFEQPLQLEPEEEKVPAPKPEKSGFSKFVGKVKTGIALGATLAGIAATTPDFEAHAADRPRVESRAMNDHTRNEHFQDFTLRYTDALRSIKKAKTPEDAQKAAAVVDALNTFLKGTEWMRKGNNATLDKRFVKSLEGLRREVDTLRQKFGVAVNTITLDAAAGTFLERLNAPAKPNPKPNNGWIKTQTMGPTSLGVDIHTGGGRPTSVPRPAPTNPPRKK